ncbi:MAG: AraC family transcriptional regulator [Pseudomonadota bacterium]
MDSDASVIRDALRTDKGLERHAAAPGAHRYDRHAHDEYSVIVVTQGRKLLRIGREEHVVHKDQIVLVPPGASHDCEPIGQSDWAHRCWYLSPGLVAELTNQPAARTDALRLETVVAKPFFARTLTTLHNALSDPAGASEDRLSCRLRQLSLLADLFGDAMGPDALPARGPRRSRARAHAYDAALRDALSNKLDLDALADLGGVTRFQVIRDLKAAYDMTPGTYLRDLRLRESKRMLRQGHALADVGQALGFADQSHFSRSFKRAYGMSPLRYRQSIQAT